ncbi:MAG: hypothetical protein JO352_27550 [Chloroflexi bacterium]|nr:hypothetical protein [Chloroflexota bacterium]MBV9596401.1 hypothetical protein [Chloroflexota bacterium]
MNSVTLPRLPEAVQPEHVSLDMHLECPAEPDENAYAIPLWADVIVQVWPDHDADKLSSEEPIKVNVGMVHATLFKVGQAEEINGRDGLYVLEEESEESAEYMQLFNAEGVRADVYEMCELSTFAPDVLLVNMIQIEPEFRCRDLGLHAMRALVSVFANGSTLIACTPFPPNQHQKSESVGHGSVLEPLYDRTKDPRTDAEIAAGQRKLRAHWSRFGLRRFRRTDIYIMGGAQVGRVTARAKLVRKKVVEAPDP